VCGVDNGQILHNYRTLVNSGKNFITRIPLIPGVVETEENLTAIASFLRECGVTRAEVLPYNKLAGSKYAALLKPYSFEPGAELPPCRSEEIFASFGVAIKRM
ncbi:MAG: glycyl-radical enzyme activating protein, partial [Clostridia bacterium]|nr:glycyl-radical enzyme activating protein [Clostridia bacterium]